MYIEHNFSNSYGKVGVIFWLLFHLIWKNYVLYWDFDLKSWFVDFFHSFHSWKNTTKQLFLSKFQCRKLFNVYVYCLYFYGDSVCFQKITYGILYPVGKIIFHYHHLAKGIRKLLILLFWITIYTFLNEPAYHWYALGIVNLLSICVKILLA